MEKKADDIVMELRKNLLEKKSLVLGTEKPVYTAGEWFQPDLSSSAGSFNLRAANKFQIMKGAKSVLLHKETAEVVGLEIDYLGFSVTEWLNDFKTRVSVLNRAENLRKISIIETELSKLLTPAQLREIGIGDLADKIKDL